MDEPRFPSLIALPDALRGPRVVVRPWRPDDAPALYAAIDESRAALASWLPWVSLYTDADVAHDYCRSAAADWLLRRDLPVGVFAAADGAVLGGSGLTRLDWRARTFEIGYWLRRSAEGHGYMLETVRLLTALAFDDLGAQRVTITCDARNERSRRVAERAGYVFEGRLRHDRLDPAGRPADTLVFSLIPADWARLGET